MTDSNQRRYKHGGRIYIGIRILLYHKIVDYIEDISRGTPIGVPDTADTGRVGLESLGHYGVLHSPGRAGR